MVRLFVQISAALLALALVTPADAGVRKLKGDCLGEMCNWHKHPRPRVLKPIACIPLRFDQWKSGTVTIRIDYFDGRPSKYDSKPAGLIGSYCRGESIWRGGSVCLCNEEAFATLTADEIAEGLARARSRTGRFGWLVTLKGGDWAASHGARRDTVPCVPGKEK